MTPLLGFRLEMDPGRIELPPPQCECDVMPLYYGPLINLQSLFPHPSFAARVLGKGFFEFCLVKRRPECFGQIKLGICRVPHHESGRPMRLASGADHEVNGREIACPEARLQCIGIYSLRQRRRETPDRFKHFTPPVIAEKDCLVMRGVSARFLFKRINFGANVRIAENLTPFPEYTETDLLLLIAVRFERIRDLLFEECREYLHFRGSAFGQIILRSRPESKIGDSAPEYRVPDFPIPLHSLAMPLPRQKSSAARPAPVSVGNYRNMLRQNHIIKTHNMPILILDRTFATKVLK